ncbi:MAG: DUF3306 domain-containing protein [Xanthobacteraceae bacterium]|nr:DUF3306 domain-containing protein [Xanthobacteraceae bacterium]
MSSEEEGFLNRWSRRKQEAAKEAVETELEAAKESAPAEPDAAAIETAEEEFDVSKLPPIDSITAGTDIRAFLSKGVPAALTQAALRRAWSADPAIRDYIGLSEYSWDFNSPGIDGFGPLDPSINVPEMVADVFGKVKQAVSDAEALAEKTDSLVAQTQSAVLPAEPSRSVELRSENVEAAAVREPGSVQSENEGGDKSALAAAAPHQPESSSEQAAAPVRRHGTALPS